MMSRLMSPQMWQVRGAAERYLGLPCLAMLLGCFVFVTTALFHALRSSTLNAAVLMSIFNVLVTVFIYEHSAEVYRRQVRVCLPV